MCLTIPAKVLSIETPATRSSATEVIVESSGRVKRIKALASPGLKPGDWVLSAYDTAIRVISADDAKEILDLLQPKRHIDVSVLGGMFMEALKSHSTGGLARDGIVRLLKTEDPLEMETLFAEANTIRQVHLKDFFCIHGIVEFSNHCVRDCFYCGLRK
ncbi:MAG: HypC/HybG/HupF family hydrogenase formation chaperone, partial [Deltaproteobacteria bacterium]|nr:HypC/HybG/HupF family hydrogenase formation chaperone [Deltaproteobacteria bacterium]